MSLYGDYWNPLHPIRQWKAEVKIGLYAILGGLIALGLLKLVELFVK